MNDDQFTALAMVEHAIKTMVVAAAHIGEARCQEIMDQTFDQSVNLANENNAEGVFISAATCAGLFLFTEKVKKMHEEIR